jgi:hypothetical protein
MYDQWIRNLGIGYILLRVGPRVRLGVVVPQAWHPLPIFPEVCARNDLHAFGDSYQEATLRRKIEIDGFCSGAPRYRAAKPKVVSHHRDESPIAAVKLIVSKWMMKR